jgi:riboflavin synthase
MAAKGSVAVDGVSLTLVSVEDDRFSVQLIPHTLATTTLGQRRMGARVNIETDLLAKYVERQMLVQGSTSKVLRRVSSDT